MPSARNRPGRTENAKAAPPTYAAELERVRAIISGAGDIREVKMFGGIGFMLNGNLSAAVSSRGLLLRVGPDNMAHALKHAGTRVMEMRDRPVNGYVYAGPPALDEKAFQHLLGLAIAFTASLPPKSREKRPRRVR